MTKNSIYTPFNDGRRSTTRILRNGRWHRTESEAGHQMRVAIFGAVTEGARRACQTPALAIVRSSLGL